MKKKILAVVLAVVILAVAAVGATLAWLMDTTEAVVNTFTVGNVSIELTETITNDNGEGGNGYKLVPGNTYAKDPKVTVNADSEACYLFVKVEAAGTNVADALAYDVRTGVGEWTALDGQAGVYYREVAASDEDQSFYVLTGGADTLANGQVTIKPTLTSEQMAAIAAGTAPSLTFTAYAIQSDNLTPGDGQTEVAYAWEQVSAAS